MKFDDWWANPNSSLAAHISIGMTCRFVIRGLVRADRDRRNAHDRIVRVLHAGGATARMQELLNG
jgi:hypothetical protein